MQLSERSGHEAHIMKVLTVLAIVFIPASFTAVRIYYMKSNRSTKKGTKLTLNEQDFLQMGYIDVAGQGGRLVVSAQPGLRLYFAISIPLIVLTLMAYGLVEIAQAKPWRLMGKGLGKRISAV